MIATVISLVSIGYFADNEVFAAAGTEYTPTQPNALASYNNATNQVQVSWNFDRMDAGDKCVIKMDIEYQARATVDEVPRVSTAHYIPNHYSAISSSPTLLGNSGSYAEEVECETASFRIDMDTIMNSSLNPDNLDNVLMFLTFYATDDITKISLQEVDRIDEVFVVYSPKEVLVDGGANDQIQWSCEFQVGSVLYIDPSGSGDTIIAHGNNGDNCDKYLYIENNQSVDIGMASATGTLLPDGDTDYVYHNESEYSLLIQVSSPSTESYKGGGGNEWKTRPTFGLDHHTFRPLVENGLVINGVPFNVDNNWWTEIPMQNMTVGDLQTFKATTYAPYKVMIMEFLFGVPDVGFWQDAEAAIALTLDYDGTIIDWEVKNPESIIDTRFMMITSSDTLCFPDDDKEQCQQFTAQFSFNSAPISKVIALQAIDFRHRSQVTYFNDGIDLQGQSLLPPIQKAIISEVKNKGLQNIERIDRVNDIWMTLDADEPVKLYKRNNVDSFFPIEWNEVEKTQTEIRDIMKRNDSYFSDFKILEEKYAQLEFDSSKIQAVLGPSYGFEYPMPQLRIDSNFDILKSEEIRIIETFAEIYPNTQR